MLPNALTPRNRTKTNKQTFCSTTTPNRGCHKLLDVVHVSLYFAFVKRETRDKILKRIDHNAPPSDPALTRIRARLIDMCQLTPPPDYAQYMRSKAWREKRQQILSFYGYQCSLCKSPKDLQVHHLHYQTVGAEQMTDVAVCCKRCHFKLHLPQNTESNWAGSRAIVPPKPRQK